jgi:hypothetical protein
MKLEKRIGNKVTYSEFIAGRTVFATTINGERGAAVIFDIYRKTDGVGRSPATALNVVARSIR